MMKLRKTIRVVAALMICLPLTACLDDGGDGDGAAIIEFTNVPGASNIQTPDFVMNIVGTVTSPSDIKKVSWVNDRGGRGNANGTSTWATGNIVLMLGTNNITVSATDIDGVIISKGLSVERESPQAPTVASTADTVSMYSYNSNLANAAPVDGAIIDRKSVYFFVQPGDDWIDRGISNVGYFCCKGIEGPGDGEPYGPKTTANNGPWSVMIDLSTLQGGGIRRIRSVANFDDNSAAQDLIADFEVAASNTPAINNRPEISGSPLGAVTAGMEYSFRPVAADADGDTLSFSISGKPSWATFNRTTGRLRGTPGAGDIRAYSNIVITVSDGKSSRSLPSFSIVVEASATGSATVSWNPPLTRMDGTTLDNLAGYEIHYAQRRGDYNNKINITNSGMSSYVVDNLRAGNWYFAVLAYDRAGAYSDLSVEAQKTIK